MTLNKERKSSKKLPNIVKESNYDIIKRQRLEEKEKKLQKEKDKLAQQEKEQQRLEKIIIPYVEKLDMQLNEKQLYSFWIFADLSGFNKILVTYDEMEKLLKEDVKKYANRTVCYFSICPHHDITKQSIYYGTDIWLTSSIITIQLDDKCNIIGKNVKRSRCDIAWETPDFKISKLTFKLLETIMHIMAEHHYNYTSLLGNSLDYMIRDLQKKGHDLSAALTPLGGC